MSHKKPAILVLADGTKFRGNSIGVDGYAIGEVVFNTSMTGYQEILTDPSYTEQLVCLTYPHIGNTGTNLEDIESPKINASGLIIKDLPIYASNFRKKYTLAQYCEKENLIAIADIDTRELTRHIRKNGAQAGCICVSGQEEKALEMARKFPGLSGMDLAKVVTTRKKYSVSEGEWSLRLGYKNVPKSLLKVAAYDFGVKKNILRMLVSRGCEVEVFPANFPIEDILKIKPNGVFLSNGPGDPEPCDYAIKSIKKFLEKKIPVFGICLGHQLLALAGGASTYKMKFGHHGANHPVQDISSKDVFITSQNHGFAVDEKTLPSNIKVTHLSLFDNSLQGIEFTDTPAFSFQGHPEASPGPQEIQILFEKFRLMVKEYAKT